MDYFRVSVSSHDNAGHQHGLDGVPMSIFSRIAVLETQLVAMQRALDLAATEMNHRLNGMNDWRNTIIDRDARLLSKDVYTTEHKALTARAEKNTNDIRDLQTAKNSWMQSWMIIAGIIAAVGSATTMIALFVHR